MPILDLGRGSLAQRRPAGMATINKHHLMPETSKGKLSDAIFAGHPAIDRVTGNKPIGLPCLCRYRYHKDNGRAIAGATPHLQGFGWVGWTG